MANFAEHIEKLIEKEGGYVDHTVKGDTGGQTFAGISRVHNPGWEGWKLLDRGQTPSPSTVHAFYKPRYWDVMRLDDIKGYSRADVLFSSCVLSGPRTATRLAQAAADATVDGSFGPNTVKAVNAVEEELFVLRFSMARIARFSRIVAKNRSQGKFLRGWINRVLHEAAEAGA